MVCESLPAQQAPRPTGSGFDQWAHPCPHGEVPRPARTSSPASPPSSPSADEPPVALPFVDRVLAWPHRVLPFMNSDALAGTHDYLHLASCTGLEVRGGDSRFHWRNASRNEGFHLFKFTIAGTGYLEDLDTGKVRTIPPGHAFLIPLPSRTAYYSLDGEPWTFLWVNFIGQPALRLCSELINAYGGVFDLRRFPQVWEILTSLYQYRLENERYNVYHVSDLVYRLLMALFQFHASSAPQLPVSIANACESMKRALGNPEISIEAIAAEAGYSKFHFARKFKQHMKIGPHQYLLKLRLEKAVDLITTTDLPIKIVSERVGFKEITHFYNIFKKHMKITPGSLNRPPH